MPAKALATATTTFTSVILLSPKDLAPLLLLLKTGPTEMLALPRVTTIVMDPAIADGLGQWEATGMTQMPPADAKHEHTKYLRSLRIIIIYQNFNLDVSTLYNSQYI